MNSGSVVPAEPVDGKKGQEVFDTVAKNSGCYGVADPLACLRKIDYNVVLNSTNSVAGLLSSSSIALSYLPRPDGKHLTKSPHILLAAGQYAKIPFIIGSQEDEGTLFALFQSYLKTIPQVADYLSTLFFRDAGVAKMNELIATYPDISGEDGSPFRTGVLNNWYPQFKRLAAILGDLTFTLSRRVVLETVNKLSPEVKTWSYLSSFNYGTAIMGTFHGSDLIQVWFGIRPDYCAAAYRNYFISFTHSLDPNAGSRLYANWPQYTKASNKLMHMYADWSTYIADDFRKDTYDWMKSNINLLTI
jgi:triacylglycerol lipase